MRSGIYIQIADPIARRALVTLAEREQRNPQSQAALLVLDGLRRLGALPNSGAGCQPAEAIPA